LLDIFKYKVQLSLSPKSLTEIDDIFMLEKTQYLDFAKSCFSNLERSGGASREPLVRNGNYSKKQNS